MAQRPATNDQRAKRKTAQRPRRSAQLASTPAEIVEHLAALRAEHRLLDEQITRMAANGEDELESKRLKRRKLQLKDCIARLESLQIPDEPA
ncbi:hypothetical protein G6F22_011917 [Rhizopus arrhizus]|nr:hypothetical protein G6F22_011917 [Rhizopus arrhizus]